MVCWFVFIPEPALFPNLVLEHLEQEEQQLLVLFIMYYSITLLYIVYYIISFSL